MTELIEKGDIVTLVYTNKHVTRQIVIHAPQGEGDSWFVRDTDGDVALVNVYAATFECMVKEREEHG